MRLSVLCLSGAVAGALGACTGKPCSGKCVAALTETPEVGQAFCSSYLSLEAATTTVTETATVTSVHTNIETAFDVVTQTTLTTTVYGPTTTYFAKREEPSADPSSKIFAECSSAAARISSACSCILTPVSTVTIVETVTATEAAEETITTTATVTTGAVATESVQPTFTVPAQPIPNGDFERYSTDQTLLPWVTSASGSDGRVEPLYPLSVCASSGDCTKGQTIIRVYPPKTAGGYTSLTQESFLARPSTTYNVSFFARCLNYDASTTIDVYYQGVRVGGHKCPNGNFNKVTSGIQFTTDASGLGKLELRFVNPTGLQYLYWYADEFFATAVL